MRKPDVIPLENGSSQLSPEFEVIPLKNGIQKQGVSLKSSLVTAQLKSPLPPLRSRERGQELRRHGVAQAAHSLKTSQRLGDTRGRRHRI